MYNKSNNSGMVIFLIFIFSILAVLTFGLSFSWLWFWFIVPVFNAPVITVIQAIGISMLINLFKLGMYSQYEVKETSEDKLTVIVGYAISPLIILLVGYFITFLL